MTEELVARGPFDAIVMLDCIEHLVNPAETLAILSRAMSTGGTLMISTGDWNSFLARVMRRGWRLMTPPNTYFSFHSNADVVISQDGISCRTLCPSVEDRSSLV